MGNKRKPEKKAKAKEKNIKPSGRDITNEMVAKHNQATFIRFIGSQKDES